MATALRAALGEKSLKVLAQHASDFLLLHDSDPSLPALRKDFKNSSAAALLAA
jgi:hypothetical protein